MAEAGTPTPGVQAQVPTPEPVPPTTDQPIEPGNPPQQPPPPQVPPSEDDAPPPPPVKLPGQPHAPERVR